MGLFDFFKKNKANQKAIQQDETEQAANSKVQSMDDAINKHLIMYFITDPTTCHYVCRNLKEDTPVEFIYEKNKLSMVKNRDLTLGYCFVWLIKARENQDDFFHIFEILIHSYPECYSVALFKTANELVENIRSYFLNFSLGNNPEEVKTTLEWTCIDICVMQKFFLETSQYLVNHITDNTNSQISISDCTCLEDLQKNVLYKLKSRSFD